MNTQKLSILWLVFTLISLACSPRMIPPPAPTSAAEAVSPGTAGPPSPAPSATQQFVLTATLIPSPTPTAKLTPTVTTTLHQDLLSSPTHTPASMRLKVFLIAVGDDGVSGLKIGCGDSLVPVEVEVPYTQGVLRAALTHLLSLPETYGQSGLYNALHRADITIGQITVQDGQALIQLSGEFRLGGMCDAPRVQAQLEQTALQFSTVQQVSIFVNGIPLQDFLSGR